MSGEPKERNAGPLGSWLIAKRTKNHTRVLRAIAAVLSGSRRMLIAIKPRIHAGDTHHKQN